MRVGQGVDELHVHADLVIRLLHASFEDVGDAELLRDLSQIGRRALESLRRCARNHFQLGDLCQPRQNFVLNAFAEVRVLRIAA